MASLSENVYKETILLFKLKQTTGSSMFAAWHKATEDELAQSRTAYPESEVICWMHDGFVNKDDQIMFKSENNFFTIRDIISLYHLMALRHFLIRTHYRVNHSDKGIENASDRAYYIYKTLYDCEEMLSKYNEGGISVRVLAEENLVNRHHKAFLDNMSDDLKTTDVLDGEDGFMDLLTAFPPTILFIYLDIIHPLLALSRIEAGTSTEAVKHR